MVETVYQTDAARWDAVRARDPAADGCFVYCVKTTKIYCRPICKARLARRTNVEFFERPQQAARHGYRACKRCKPELERHVPEADLSVDRIRSLLDNLPTDTPLPKLEDLAADAGLTKYHFHRCFKKATGVTPREYILSRRQAEQVPTVQQSAAESLDSGMTTPSLVHDLDTSAAVLTPDQTDLPDVNFEDWLADEDMGFMFTPNELGIGKLGSGIDSADAGGLSCLPGELTAATSLQIYYTTVETTGGAILMAFQDDQVCKLELLLDPSDILVSLERSFPSCIYIHTPIELLPDERRTPMYSRIASVAAALEQPV